MITVQTTGRKGNDGRFQSSALLARGRRESLTASFPAGNRRKYGPRAEGDHCASCSRRSHHIPGSSLAPRYVLAVNGMLRQAGTFRLTGECPQAAADGHREGPGHSQASVHGCPGFSSTGVPGHSLPSDRSPGRVTAWKRTWQKMRGLPLDVPPTTICFVTWYRHIDGPEIDKTGIILTASQFQGQRAAIPVKIGNWRELYGH